MVGLISARLRSGLLGVPLVVQDEDPAARGPPGARPARPPGSRTSARTCPSTVGCGARRQRRSTSSASFRSTGSGNRTTSNASGAQVSHGGGLGGNEGGGRRSGYATCGRLAPNIGHPYPSGRRAGPLFVKRSVDYTKHIQKAEEAARRRNYDFAVQLYQQILEIDADVGRGPSRPPQAPSRRSHDSQEGGASSMKLDQGRRPPHRGQGPRQGRRSSTPPPRPDRELPARRPRMDVEANMLLGTTLESAGTLPVGPRRLSSSSRRSTPRTPRASSGPGP